MASRATTDTPAFVALAGPTASGKSAAALALAGTMAAPVAMAQTAAPSATSNGPASVADLAEGLLGAVVNISTRQRVQVTSANPFAGTPFADLFGGGEVDADVAEARGEFRERTRERAVGVCAGARADVARRMQTQRLHVIVS